jgi:hypothetical protein
MGFGRFGCLGRDGGLLSDRPGPAGGGAARSRRTARWPLCAAAALLLPAGLAAQEPPAQAPAAAPATAGITFFTGPNFTGESKTLTLAPDQPYAAIPFIGDELNERIASLRADPQVGAILFQRPYFASRDDACGPNVGTHEDPDAWWLGLTADFEPPYATDQAYETAETADGDYSSVIAYRRDVGPPPGFLLLERRSYYNRACERSADQSYFNRIVIPVPNPPQREACTDLSAPSRAHGAGPDAPRFDRVTEAYALLPQAFSRGYQGGDHRFILTVFDGPGCSGASITLPGIKDGRPASYRLSEFDFDRRARSVSIRYQRGPLDRHLADVPETAEAAPAPAPAPTPAPTATPTPTPTPGPDAGTVMVPSPTPAPTPAVPAAQETPQSPSQQPLSPPPAGGLQPAPPSAPPQSQQQALQPMPQPQLAPQPAPAPSRPIGPQEETFRFPVHQVYRLNYCLADGQGCGEPAANAWCEARGFARASRWNQEENIGALYPTVFIGNGGICDKYLCDGFEEITCTQVISPATFAGQRKSPALASGALLLRRCLPHQTLGSAPSSSSRLSWSMKEPSSASVAGAGSASARFGPSVSTLPKSSAGGGSGAAAGGGSAAAGTAGAISAWTGACINCAAAARITEPPCAAGTGVTARAPDWAGGISPEAAGGT